MSVLKWVGWAANLCGATLLVAEGNTPADADAALAASRARLAELRRVCKDAHPLVQLELQRIVALERRRQLPSTPATELMLAREKLAELRRTCKDQHPAVQAQLRLIADLEKKTATSAGSF